MSILDILKKASLTTEKLAHITAYGKVIKNAPAKKTDHLFVFLEGVQLSNGQSHC